MWSLSAFTSVTALFEFSVLLLDARGIQQHNPGNISGRRRAIDRIAKTIADEPGEKSRVVKVSMSQEDGIDIRRRTKEVFPVTGSQVTLLIQPAINQKFKTIRFNKMARAGDVFGCPKECYFDMHLEIQ
jgi:hypothetical protein